MILDVMERFELGHFSPSLPSSSLLFVNYFEFFFINHFVPAEYGDDD